MEAIAQSWAHSVQQVLIYNIYIYSICFEFSIRLMVKFFDKETPQEVLDIQKCVAA